jgi:hypothetical protein
MTASRGPPSAEEASIAKTEPDGTENSSAEGSIISETGAEAVFLRVYFMKP